MRNKVKIGIALLVIVLVGLQLACKKPAQVTSAPSATKSDTPAPGKAAAPADFAGTYNLASVDGHPIPYAPMHEGQQAPSIVGGSLTLKGDGSFTSTMSFGNPSGGTINRDFKGTYVKEGARLILSWEGAGQNEVTIDGNVLTMNNEGVLFVYKKNDAVSIPTTAGKISIL